VQFECHPAGGEPHNLKEIRPFLATMVADNETLCTDYLVDFSERSHKVTPKALDDTGSKLATLPVSTAAQARLNRF
jgi:hypothetical protein